MKVNDYVRTIEGYIFEIIEIDKDRFYVKEDGAFLFKEDITKSSPNIIDLIEVGDVIRYEIETSLESNGILKSVGDVTDEEMLEKLKKDKAFHVKSIVTREQFSQIEYRIEE